MKLVVLLLGVWVAGCGPVIPIRSVLERQAADWNRGDIDAFMEGYVRSDRLTFSAGGVVQRGWEAVRQRYHQRYPNAAAMGHLTFSDLEITGMGSDAALVLGRYQVDTAADSAAGAFSLVFQKRGGRWLIVHDHTSADSQP